MFQLIHSQFFFGFSRIHNQVFKCSQHVRTRLDPLVVPVPSYNVDELDHWNRLRHQLLLSHIFQDVLIPFVVLFVLLVLHLDPKVSNENCLLRNF